MSNEYHFVTRWRLRAGAQEVADVLRDARDLPRWWPSVYLDVQVLEEGDPMRLELERRRLPAADADRVGPPPGPTFAWLIHSGRRVS